MQQEIRLYRAREAKIFKGYPDYKSQEELESYLLNALQKGLAHLCTLQRRRGHRGVPGGPSRMPCRNVP